MEPSSSVPSIAARRDVNPTWADRESNAKRKMLKVVDVDLRIGENAKAHHTDRYEWTQQRETDNVSVDPCLVVRRGEPFDIFIRFDRPFDSSKDDIQLIFDFGDNTRESRGTQAVLLLSAEDEPKKWGAKIVNQEGETFAIRIFTPPQVTVGKWNFGFNTVFRVDGKREFYRHQHSYPVYILFNPWCADDQVFMSDESSRNEYVLNDCGRIFSGTSSSVSPIPWNFGQFEDFVLDVAMLLLDMSRLRFSFRGNSIEVVRKISALVNSNDDNGVLVGNWSGDYADGTSPAAWNGSVAILEEYWKTRKPVKYGQCWVFSAVVTTICRALGIPCRSVTNYQSGHDTDGSLTLDEYSDYRDNRIEDNDHKNDSVWNFHVWNEVWMARPDLPDGFGGWQAIDATPQEKSDEVYCTGPCSVEAIRQGRVQLPYDGTFIFAEVNADFVRHVQMKDGTWQHNVLVDCIGKNISTKGPDGDQRLDVTDLYKFREGSQEERTAVYSAVASCATRNTLYQVDAKDVDFSLVQKDNAIIGEPFDVVLKIRNKHTREQRTVKATLTATVVKYTGVPVASIKSYSQAVIVMPNAEEEVKMTVTVADYLDKLTDMCHIKMASMSRVKETKQFHCDSDDFRLSKPTIHVKVPPKMKLGAEYEIEASFTNPISKTLTQCEFSFEAPSLQRPIKLFYADVLPQGVVKCSTKLTPLKMGETEVIVGFWSKELSDITGTAKVKVTKKKN